MRILFVMPRFPCPPDRGDKVRPYNFARVLAREHTLGLISFEESPITIEDRSSAESLFSFIRLVKKNKWSSWLELMKSALSSQPWQIALFRSSKMTNTIEKAIIDFKPNVIYTFHLRMAQYTNKIQGVYRILDLTDAVSLFLHRMLPHRPIYLRPLIWREERAVRDFEMHIAPQYDEIWLISNVDADAIPGANQWSNLNIIPNGVDTDYFSPEEEPSREIEAAKEPRILFVGFMGVESINAIEYFYFSIYPLIKKAVPGVRFMIVGKNPPDRIIKLSADQSVEVIGYASDLAACYQKSMVSIAPMKFVVGIQNKILESMACGVPVVATSQAHEGITAQPGIEIFVADNENSFAKHVINLLIDPNFNKFASSRARDFVVKNYKWEIVAQRISKINLLSSNSK